MAFTCDIEYSSSEQHCNNMSPSVSLPCTADRWQCHYSQNNDQSSHSAPFIHRVPPADQFQLFNPLLCDSLLPVGYCYYEPNAWTFLLDEQTTAQNSGEDVYAKSQVLECNGWFRHMEQRTYDEMSQIALPIPTNSMAVFDSRDRCSGNSSLQDVTHSETSHVRSNESDTIFNSTREITRLGKLICPTIGVPNDDGTCRCAYKGCSSQITFSRACDLRKHYNRHRRIYFCRHRGCPQGSKGFSSRKDQSRHEGKHNPSVECEWEGCQRRFSRMDNMKDHLRRVHKCNANVV